MPEQEVETSYCFDLFTNEEWRSTSSRDVMIYFADRRTTNAPRTHRKVTPNENFDISWLSEILSDRENGNIQREMVDFIRGTRELIAKEQFELVGKLVGYMVTRHDLPLELVIASLRASYAARRKIPRWRKLVSIARAEIAKREKNPDTLLQGLEPK